MHWQIVSLDSCVTKFYKLQEISVSPDNSEKGTYIDIHVDIDIYQVLGCSIKAQILFIVI